MSKILLTTIFLCLTVAAFAQNPQLANQYYNNREYEKAAAMYKNLHDQQNNDYYFEKYIDCLVNMESYDQALNELRGELKKFPDKVQFYVLMGEIYELRLMPEKADEAYATAIEKLPPRQAEIARLGNAFRQQTKYDMAIEVFTKGMNMLKDTMAFSYHLADLYGRKGDTREMIYYYLLNAQANRGGVENMKNIFQRRLQQQEDYRILQEELYKQISRYPDEVYYPELLEWTFIQLEDYYNALRQARALDRKLNENGARVFNVGQIAMNDGDYDTAIQAFEYVVENQNLNSSWYLASKQMLIDSRRQQLYQTGEPTLEQLRELEQEYIDFLNEFGRTPRTALLISELAEFEARYMKDIDKAIAYLEGLIDIPGTNEYLIGNAKLKLGDYYLLKGERWEATLLYSQVDKQFPEELLGEEARFRNAKLSYYIGDFEWAQEQFDILKASTSKLISNDAIDLSVFIMDNIGLDSTTVPLEIYARAELNVFQGQYDKALAQMDSLEMRFPEHGLEDDVLYLKARVFQDRRQYEKAAEAYAKIVEKFPEDIRGDNSMYELAILYETVLQKPEKAVELYETLFIEYPGSVFAVDARKRYRALRGDFESS